MANVSEFRYQLFNQGEILARLKYLSQEVERIPKYKQEIETYLCICLDQITRINEMELNADLGTSFQKQQLQSFKIFNRYLITQALNRPYKLRRLDDPEEPDIVSDAEDEKQPINEASEAIKKISGREEKQAS